MQKEADCLKQMYKLAKEIETINRSHVLHFIVKEAFDVSCQGAMSARCSTNREKVESAWVKDAKMFASTGLAIAKTLRGENQSMTKEWEARSANPIKFFLIEFKGEHFVSL